MVVFYLFIYGLFNDAVWNSHYTVLNGRVIHELERIWKDAVVAYFKVDIIIPALASVC
jgi:hypothetical protein